jgi:hypothetical protein
MNKETAVNIKHVNQLPSGGGIEPPWAAYLPDQLQGALHCLALAP